MHPHSSARGRQYGPWRIAWLTLAGLCAHAIQAAPVAARDALGQELRLATPARRIVSLSPHATELLFAAGAGPQVVGVSQYSDWPAEARKRTQVGGYEALDLERVLALKPDLVVGWASGNNAAQIAQLRRMNLQVYLSEPKQFADIAADIRKLGQLAGTASQAEARAASLLGRIEALRTRYAKRQTVRVFYQIWSDPLMTLNGEHLVSQVLTLCGGRNVFDALGTLAPTVTEEAVLKAAPEAILSPSEPGVAAGALDRWKKWSALPAVAAGNLIAVDGNLLNRSGPRIVEGAEQVCVALDAARKRLHP
ncbi:cobalamin-binding protein [Niveibacterium sp. SC-1]|uniref:cobalamin-binding protein n=1 Tax=Niveibacterium sp. SC-1 TaxID=3135646 RepID=UPI00311F4ABD